MLLTDYQQYYLILNLFSRDLGEQNMPVQFTRFNGPDNLHFAKLHDNDGKLILMCRGCQTSDCFTDCINDIRRSAARDELYERNSTPEGKWFFNLRSVEGKIIATSRMHDTSFEMERSISASKSIASESRSAFIK